MRSHSLLRGLGRRLIRYYVYFKAAHARYFVFVMGATNFIVITYKLLLVDVLGFPLSPQWFLTYAILFALCYVTICIVLGWLDYRKLTIPMETALSTVNNPYNRDYVLVLNRAIVESLVTLLEKNGDREAAEKLWSAYLTFVRTWFPQYVSQLAPQRSGELSSQLRAQQSPHRQTHPQS